MALAVKPRVVVMRDVLLDHSAGIVKGKWDTGTDEFFLDGSMKALQFAV